MSFSPPILLPGGKPLIVDGKFNKAAQNCCCCVAYTPATTGLPIVLTVDTSIGGEEAYSSDAPTAAITPPWSRVWDRTIGFTGVTVSNNRYVNDDPVWLSKGGEEAGQAYLGIHTFDDGHVGWIVAWGTMGDLDGAAFSTNPIDFTYVDWCGELCSPVGGTVGPTGTYKRIGGINLSKEVVVT